ncbi:hypothetical protein KIN20_026270 [Parelaphostrongylus tenuis]|uniref:Uncharacterized protein n=1 Tax=Parelaphostrongylus tenuis TaxID=148309 RepID=A0AAD5QX29_PARTN|nr:hypothetical protein KIN20_026270 [Parelaphostrongylus tenuis]
MNIIIVNWSRMMWEGLMDRAVRMLLSGPFESHLFQAVNSLGVLSSDDTMNVLVSDSVMVSGDVIASDSVIASDNVIITDGA